MTTTDKKKQDSSLEMNISPASTAEEQSQQAPKTPQELYKQGMQEIWGKIDHLPKGQDQVVMSQNWWFGKSPTRPTPKDFPALVAHGFIVEKHVEDQVIWEPYSPYLKDFWRVGIDVTLAYGFRLRPYSAFQASLSAAIQMIFS